MLNSQGFDLWADGYDRSVQLSEEADSYPFAGYRQVLGTVYRLIREGEGRRVLDIGFGTAVLSGRLYQEGYDITGLDFSPRMLELAREKMPGARLLLWDFTRGLPPELAGERFDAIVCTYASHHLTEDEKSGFIRDLLDCLTPGGRLLIGDVAFESREQLERCRLMSGDEWDEEEYYPVAEELRQEFPALRFLPCSHCAAVLIFEKNLS